MNSADTLSVVMPVFNRAAFVSEALDAVLTQTRPAEEIIVVDDGSTDSTSAVLAGYAPRVRTVRIDNSGCGMARRAGAEHATGQWIAFCDSDDRWRPDHLERKFALLERYPDVDMLFSNFANFGPDADPDFNVFDAAPRGWWEQFEGAFDPDGFRMLGQDQVRPFIRFNPAWPTTIMLSRELYLRSGGNNPLFARLQTEDGEFTRRCILHGTVGCDRQVTASLRRHAGNVSHSKHNGCVCKHILLEHALSRHTLGEAAQGPIHAEMGRLAYEVFHQAFAQRDYRLVSRFAPHVPPHLRLRRRYLTKRLAAVAGRLLRVGGRTTYPEHFGRDA